MQSYCLLKSHIYTDDADFGQHEEDIFTDLFQPPRADLLQPSHGKVQPYIIRWDEKIIS
jgi:hypothetical protein